MRSKAMHVDPEVDRENAQGIQMFLKLPAQHSHGYIR